MRREGKEEFKEKSVIEEKAPWHFQRRVENDAQCVGCFLESALSWHILEQWSSFSDQAIHGDFQEL